MSLANRYLDWRGHLNRNLRFRSRGLPQENIPGSHEPPAYGVVLLDEDQLVINTHDYMDSSPKFSLGSWDWSAWNNELEQLIQNVET